MRDAERDRREDERQRETLERTHVNVAEESDPHLGIGVEFEAIQCDAQDDAHDAGDRHADQMRRLVAELQQFFIHDWTILSEKSTAIAYS